MNYKNVDFMQNYYINSLKEITPFKSNTGDGFGENITAIADYDFLDFVLNSNEDVGITAYRVAGSPNDSYHHAIFSKDGNLLISATGSLRDSVVNTSTFKAFNSYVRLEKNIYSVMCLYNEDEIKGVSTNNLFKYDVGTTTWSQVSTTAYASYIAKYRNRFVLGTTEGNIIFSKPELMDFTIGATINDALLFKVSDYPIVCIKATSNSLYILDSVGGIYTFNGTLISTQSAVGLDKLGMLETYKPNHKSLIVFNNNVFAIGTRGIFKLYRGSSDLTYSMNITSEHSERYFDGYWDNTAKKFGLLGTVTKDGVIIVSRYEYKTPAIGVTDSITYIGYYIYTDTFFIYKEDISSVSTPITRVYKGYWFCNNYKIVYLQATGITQLQFTVFDLQDGAVPDDSWVMFDVLPKLDNLSYTGNFTILYDEKENGTMTIYYKNKNDVKTLKTVSVTAQSYTGTEPEQSIFDYGKKIATQRLLIGAFDNSGQLAIQFNNKIYQVDFKTTEV